MRLHVVLILSILLTFSIAINAHSTDAVSQKNSLRHDPMFELNEIPGEYKSLAYLQKFPFSGKKPSKKKDYSPVPESLTKFLRKNSFDLWRDRRSLDICYFLGNDILKSHLIYNENWGDETVEGVKRYINELTYQANRLLGLENIRLTWKGPFDRHDKNLRYPEDPEHDSKSVSSSCDVAIFLVFNDYSTGLDATTNGHLYSGFTKGGACELGEGKGYAVIVDQGFLGDTWVGPQILSHYLLLLLTSDLYDGSLGYKESKYCRTRESLLYRDIIIGSQKIDICIVDKLNRSNVSERSCMQD
ncbi:unnamed protein product [Lepeophtheirus salmonis]|uniref:(salmon louse) hypothetical protein n=1 Tax=Lepeophtheirus salmonis TaxID=72036 RepID=A0A7R8CV55_LEPSM|nr:unnamed protein product [Lepeophtheirus salmonis]CAF2905249.1 unnamed protein product [Lepeophtheirus salmonis]